MQASRSDSSGANSSMLSTIKKLQHQIDSVTRYLTPLLPLANCHMVEFLTKNHWETLLPEKLRTVLDDLDLDCAVNKFWEYAESSCHKDANEVSNWIATARSHCLAANNEYCLSKDQLQDCIISWGGTIEPEIKVTQFMTSKKSYEVATMSQLVASLYGATSSKCCVEAGGGRGHLLVALCLGYNVPSLTVDCDENKVRAAAARVKIIQKQWHAISKRLNGEHATVQQPSPNRNYTELHRYDTNQNRSDTDSHQPDTVIVRSVTSPHSFDTNLHRYDSNRNHSNTDFHCSDTNLHLSDTNLHRTDTNLHRSVRNLHLSDTTLNRFDTNLHRSDTNMHRFATAFITKDTDLAGVVAEKFPETNGDVKFLLTGLHTCGDLGPASLRIFAARASTAAVFNVPCCYHLLTEGVDDDKGFPMSNYLKGYKLGRNARMLAAQSIDRVVGERQLPAKSLLYRALLQLLIKTHLPDEIISEKRLKKLSSCDSFQEYFKMADAILDLGLYDKLPQSCLIEIYNGMDCQWRKLVLFYLLRLCLAQVVETVILTDRLLFLFENEFDKVYLVKLFDPVLSPRCHGIVAVR